MRLRLSGRSGSPRNGVLSLAGPARGLGGRGLADGDWWEFGRDEAREISWSHRARLGRELCLGALIRPVFSSGGHDAIAGVRDRKEVVVGRYARWLLPDAERRRPGAVGLESSFDAGDPQVGCDGSSGAGSVVQRARLGWCENTDGLCSPIGFWKRAGHCASGDAGRDGACTVSDLSRFGTVDWRPSPASPSVAQVLRVFLSKFQPASFQGSLCQPVRLARTARQASVVPRVCALY